MTTAVELHDVQGLVARGFGNLPAAAFLLVAIEDRSAGHAWLDDVAAALTPADERPERQALNVAFTSHGLRQLGLDDDAFSQFSNAFVDGMTTAHRRRLLGDVGDSAPERWDWGGPSTSAVDAVLLLYAVEESALVELERTYAPGEGLRVLARLGTSNLDGREPFGFRDGISQPLLEGLSKTGRPETTIRFGEIVLGYPNEYGRYTERPLLDAATDPGRMLPRDGGRPDFGRNGSYLVFRQLSQDVRGFWRFVERRTQRPDGGSDPTRRVQLAAKMVGRWPSGAPLALASDADDPALSDANDFTYHQDDRRGERCPIGAHIRRANPRDSLDPRPGTASSWAINRRHRILRRGREYGTELTPEDALADGLEQSGDDRGLHFICLNGNIARQFEFVSGTWLNSPKFAGLYDDADPLVGPSEPYGGTFTVQSSPLRGRVTDVPRFVTVRGGAYFFLPGIAATRYLAARGGTR